MNKQAVHIVKNCDDDILEKTAIEHCDNTALIKKAAWIVAWELKNSCILVKCIAETVENSDVSALEKEAAEAVKNCDISAFDEEVTSAFDEQVAEISEIDKSFNFCCLQQELETENSEQSVFLTHDE